MTVSYLVEVGGGVPQSSVIGPLLFLIFINHVVSGLNCKFCFFADDQVIFSLGNFRI